MHHTIIAVDVAGFGARGGWHQRKVREALSSAVRETLDHCGVASNDCHIEDRGDGLLILAPPDVQNKRLAECLPKELAARLHEHNVTADADARIRLRVVLHAGEIDSDRQGRSGKAVVRAFRLLDSGTLRRELAGSTGDVALIASAPYFQDVIANYPAAYPENYHQVTVSEKETTENAWVFLPDNHIPHAPDEHPAAAAPARSGGGRHRRARQGGRRVRAFAHWLRAYLPVVLLAVVLLTGSQVSDVLAAVPPSDQCAEPVQLNVIVSGEKAPVIRKLVPSFIRATSRGDCKTVNVQVTAAQRSDEVIAALGRGWSSVDDVREVGPEPFVWLPDSTWEVQAATKELRDNRNTDLTLAGLGPIARSPLVMVSSAAAPGAESDAGQPRDWSEVLAAATRPARPGEPGTEFRRPSPRSSGTGLVSTLALYAAQLGEPLVGQTFTGTETPQLLHDVEQSVPTSDDPSDSLLCLVRERADGGAPDVPDLTVLVSEKAAADYVAGDAPGPRCAGERPAAATAQPTYPKDGTPYLDHPFVMVNWNDRPVNERRQRAVRSFYDFLVSRDAQDELRRARFRDRNDGIEGVAGVLPGRPAELPVGDVEVDALLQAYEDARKSARVLLLVDVSRSMAEPFRDSDGTRLRAGIDAVRQTLQSIGGKDEVALWTFAEGWNGPSDHREEASMGPSDQTRMSLTRLAERDLDTRVNKALRAAIDDFGISGRTEADTRNAIVVITGANEPESDTGQLADQLRSMSRPVPVFVIAPRYRCMRLTELGGHQAGQRWRLRGGQQRGRPRRRPQTCGREPVGRTPWLTRTEGWPPSSWSSRLWAR